MEKQKSKTERIGFTKNQMLSFLKIMQTNTDRLLVLQEAFMQEQQKSFHESWKVRYLTRRLKAINPNEAVTEEELQEQIKRSEN